MLQPSWAHIPVNSLNSTSDRLDKAWILIASLGRRGDGDVILDWTMNQAYRGYMVLMGRIIRKSDDALVAVRAVCLVWYDQDDGQNGTFLHIDSTYQSGVHMQHSNKMSLLLAVLIILVRPSRMSFSSRKRSCSGPKADG